MEANANTIRTMGIISNEVYNSTPGKDYFNDNPDDIIIKNKTYKVLDHTGDWSSNGFQALLLQEEGTKNYVIAFRGTQEKFDIVDDAIIGLQNHSYEFQAAKAWVNTILHTKDKGY